MNKIYQRIWSKVKERWILVNEKVASRGCPSGIVGAIILAAFLSLSSTTFALDNGALPTGGKITSGTGSIATTGRQMTVNQSTDKMIANWDTFNIGRKAGVTFQQPDKNSVALNKIYDQNPSQILGTLSSNGKIFLINPSGIVFGKGSQVNVGGLVASSLNMADKDFLAGKYTFLNDGNAGSVINKGSITAVNGGVVALIAPKVTNEGTITANGGSVILGAGNQVTLDFNGDGLISYTIDKGAVDALVANKGLIKADGGMVVLTAEAANSLTQAVVNNSGVIKAQTLENKGGRILLLSDMENGQTIVSGKLDASAPNGGNGGFIETASNDVKATRGAKITALAPQGTNGTWLIDPTNFTIVSGSNPRNTNSIGATTLKNALVNANVTIATDPAGTEKGDINVIDNANVTWSQNILSLQAHGDININAVLTANNTAALDMRAGYSTPGTDGGTYNGIDKVRVGFNNDGTFKGQVDFFQADGSTPRSGTGFLTINGNGYTVITDLGAAGSTTGTDLQGMNGNLSGYYALGSNIVATGTTTWNSGAGFDPIGNSGTAFTGQFDGLGHTISNLSINRPNDDYVGLFGYTSGASLRNVGVVDASITGRSNVGALVGYNDYSKIDNSYSTGTVTGEYHNEGIYSVYVGGLVGYNNHSNISNSHSGATVTGTVFTLYGSDDEAGDANVGGLVGYNDSGNINNAYTTGNVTGTGGVAYCADDEAGDANVGGLVGYNTGTTAIINSHASGSVTGTGGDNNQEVYCPESLWMAGDGDAHVGGLVGYAGGSTAITDSYATGNVTGTGGTSTMDGQWCVWSGDNAYVGGLVGYTNGTTAITNSHATGNVTGTGGNTSNSDNEDGNSLGGNVFAGGLVGYSKGTTTIDNSYYATGAVSGTGGNAYDNSYSGGGWVYLGGLVGYHEGSTINISNSNSTGNVNGTGGNAYGYISDNNANGACGGGVLAGGLVGYTSATTTIDNSYATGNVTGIGGNGYAYHDNGWGAYGGDVLAGGLVGYTSATTTIDNSYATGNVTGTNGKAYSSLTAWGGWVYTGGLVGYNSGTATIANSYATGTVTGTGGNAYSSGDFGHSYGGDVYTGGLVGYTSSGTISNSYAIGMVTGHEGHGFSYGANGSSLDGNVSAGGLVGYNYGGSATNSFWDTQTTGQTTSALGTGKTTADMKTFQTYVDAGWDINTTGAKTNIWAIDDGKTYPWLTVFSP